MASPPLSPFRPSVEIDLDAVCANYRAIRKAAPGAEAAGVVKCNGYGLGAAEVARALAATEGCRTFFVAYPEEGVALRAALQPVEPAAQIYVFNGPHKESMAAFADARLIPVLNTLTQAEFWAAHGAGAPAALHIDTGMNRLGAPVADVEAIRKLPLEIELVMSHLACSSEPAHVMNARQRAAFDEVATLFPNSRRSLSASGGAMMTRDYHYDLVRPGIALYGASPFDKPDRRLKAVARLTAPVLQLRNVEPGETAGYGATRRFERRARLATVAFGYGDGFPRAHDDRGSALLGGAFCPLAGRVSMDLIVLDVSDAPQGVEIGDRAEFFGPALPIETAAEAAGTIAYELLTGLGGRLDRRYLSKTPQKRRSEGKDA